MRTPPDLVVNLCESIGGDARGEAVVPTLLDTWITCSTVKAPCGCESWMVAPVIVTDPGAVSITVLGLTRPVSTARPIVKGFMTEPGSKVSVKARLRSWAPLRLERLAGE